MITGHNQSRAIVEVGDGRGCFITVQREMPPLLLTAAHCLPELPPPHGGGFTEAPTYALLRPIGRNRQAAAIEAECLYVDPVADLAVLGAPDGQAGYDDEAYDQFASAHGSLRVGVLTRRSHVQLFGLDNHWHGCVADVGGHGRTITVIGGHIVGGMSGSPILDARGQVVGVVSVGSESGGIEHDEQHGQPAPLTNLPPWILADLQGSHLTKLARAVVACRAAWQLHLRRSFNAAKKANRLHPRA